MIATALSVYLENDGKNLSLHGFVLKFYPDWDFYNASPPEDNVFTCVWELNGFDDIFSTNLLKISLFCTVSVSENLAASTLNKLSTGP